MNYKDEHGYLTTICPFGKKIKDSKRVTKIGSYYCQKCIHFISRDADNKIVSCELELAKKAQALLKEIE